MKKIAPHAPGRRPVPGLVASLSMLFALHAVAGWAAEAPPPDAAAKPAAPVLIETLSRSQMSQLLQKQGYSTEVVTKDDGFSFVRSATNGTNFFVLFYDCSGDAPQSADAPCHSFELQTGVFLATPAPTAAQLDSWSRDSWWAHAVLDSDGRAYLRTTWSTVGGVSEAYLLNMLRLWDWRVNEFAKFVAATAAPAAKP